MKLRITFREAPLITLQRLVTCGWVHHPRYRYALWRKWHHRPGIGDKVEDCRGEIHTVAGFTNGNEDNLEFEDGHRASWMNCCDAVKIFRNCVLCPVCGRIIHGVRCEVNHYEKMDN